MGATGTHRVLTLSRTPGVATVPKHEEPERLNKFRLTSQTSLVRGEQFVKLVVPYEATLNIARCRSERFHS